LSGQESDWRPLTTWRPTWGALSSPQLTDEISGQHPAGWHHRHAVTAPNCWRLHLSAARRLLRAWRVLRPQVAKTQTIEALVHQAVALRSSAGRSHLRIEQSVESGNARLKPSVDSLKCLGAELGGRCY
jgi:hypothetical protein